MTYAAASQNVFGVRSPWGIAPINVVQPDLSLVQFLSAELRATDLSSGAIRLTMRRAEVSIFNDGILVQPRLAESSAETLVVARGDLALEQQTEPVFARQVDSRRVELHLQECVRHGGQAEVAQALGQGMNQHRLSFQ